MDRTQKNLKLLAVFSYAMMAAGLILGTNYATLIMVALLIVAVVLSKDAQDDNAVLPVVGAQVLYFGVQIFSVVLSILAMFLARIDDWIVVPLSEDKYPSNWGSYNPTSTWLETTNEILDFIIFLVSLAAVVFAVIAVIDLLRGANFSKTLVGKLAKPFACRKEVYYCVNCGEAVKGEFCGKCGTKKE